jgi:hypothetical protein
VCTPWQLFCHLLRAYPQTWHLLSPGEPLRLGQQEAAMTLDRQAL